MDLLFPPVRACCCISFGALSTAEPPLAGAVEEHGSTEQDYTCKEGDLHTSIHTALLSFTSISLWGSLTINFSLMFRTSVSAREQISFAAVNGNGTDDRLVPFEPGSALTSPDGGSRP